VTQPPLCYPHPLGTPGKAPAKSGMHQTSGLAGNYALDFMCPGGTQVLAPQDATVWRLSGRDPAAGVVSGSVFGWSLYLITEGGVLYFLTHFGDRKVKLGAKVKRGALLGHVGHWPNDPGRSHSHIGVTHPAGAVAAKARIVAVSKAPRVLPPGGGVPPGRGFLDGIGAMFVRCDNDPGVQAAKIPGLTWTAVKVGGTDVADPAETSSWIARMRARGVTVGAWVYCTGPPERDVREIRESGPWPFVIYNVESPYKADEGGPFQWSSGLVLEHRAQLPSTPAVVSSYGSYKTSIDFPAFVAAGWPLLAQMYDGAVDGDELTYLSSHGGVYPNGTVHRLTRRLSLSPGEAVYRPESIAA
jgi:hypothetical protein